MTSTTRTKEKDDIVTTAPAAPKIALLGVSRFFGRSAAVDDVSLAIEDGEFFVLLGPSGCGKSTLLRMIAGLQPVSSGTIEIDGRAAQDMEADERDLAFVFQNYALYPHMSVRRNMSFPLLMRRFRWWHHIPVVGWVVRRRLMRSPEVADVIDRIAETLGLNEMLDRLPATLSGGQRQRVALGRAMVREPLAFLMDEPLSNLDAKLRAQTRSELIRFHRLLKTTIVYVTHDQVEAMTMGDKIGVMKDGVLQQVGTPRAVYENPANTFVAQFIGTPAMNLLPAVVTEPGVWRVAGQDVTVDPSAAGSEAPTDRRRIPARSAQRVGRDRRPDRGLPVPGPGRRRRGLGRRAAGADPPLRGTRAADPPDVARRRPARTGRAGAVAPPCPHRPTGRRAGRPGAHPPFRQRHGNALTGD